MNPIQLFKNSGFDIKYFVNNTSSFPYFVYYGNGVDNFTADDGIYLSGYNYTIEYYFKLKSEKTEREIEKIFNDNNLIWEKSEDIYISDEQVFLIIYQY